MSARAVGQHILHTCVAAIQLSTCLSSDKQMLRDAFEGKGPQRRPQKRLDRRLEEVAETVGGGCCRLQMPLRLALAVSGPVAGHGLGTLKEAGGGVPLPFQCIPANAATRAC